MLSKVLEHGQLKMAPGMQLLSMFFQRPQGSWRKFGNSMEALYVLMQRQDNCNRSLIFKHNVALISTDNLVNSRWLPLLPQGTILNHNKLYNFSQWTSYNKGFPPVVYHWAQSHEFMQTLSNWKSKRIVGLCNKDEMGNATRNTFFFFFLTQQRKPLNKQRTWTCLTFI